MSQEEEKFFQNTLSETQNVFYFAQSETQISQNQLFLIKWNHQNGPKNLQNFYKLIKTTNFSGINLCTVKTY